MLTPYIKKVRSPLSPWEVYQSVYRCADVSFFLDSPGYQPPNQIYSYIGLHPFFEVTLQRKKITVTGSERGVYPEKQLMEVMRRLFKKYRLRPFGSSAAFFTGGAVGYLGYELVRLFENKIRFRSKPGMKVPDLYLGFYREVIAFDHRSKRYHLSVLAEPGTLKQKIEGRMDRLRAHLAPPATGKAGAADRFTVQHFKPQLARSRFESLARKAKRYIEKGDIYQANLSQRFSFGFEGSALKLYGALRKINPSPFASFLKIRDIQIISSSPERLIQKKGRWCETRPIAGTRPRVRGKALKQSASVLLRHPKERAEHIMLVDLERNDLGRVCDYRSVCVREMMGIEKYSHVIHIVSSIAGRLSKNKDAWDLVRAMFPGGTITGCPKIRCMEIIDELESVRRNLYTGSIGYFDFKGDMDLNIVIRTLILNQRRGYFQVGAGIVYDSDPHAEYDETLHKGEALAAALSRAVSS